MIESTALPQPSPEAILSEKKALSAGDVGGLTLVMFLWAICFPLIAIGLPLAPALTFATLRSFVAGTALLLLAWGRRRPWPRGWGVWLTLAGVGISMTSMGFTGMFLAGGLVSPGLATVLANVQPLLAAVLAGLVLGERLGPRRRLGLILGFLGILVVALPGFGNGSNSSPYGIGFILLGAVGVAAGNVLLKRLTGQVDVLMAIGWQFVLGGIPLLLLAQWFEPSPKIEWGIPFVAILLVLSLLGTSLAFVLWFSLLHRSELTRLNIFAFLTPAFALILGALFFGESLAWVEAGGIVLILGGILQVSRPQRLSS
ncbi:MAG: DMT family transporter [Chloroflexi bacterium]|nr:DMT family transporter [Chloroflexota bacterium]